MKNIDNIQIYNNFLLERIEKEILPCYDLWSIRSYQNRKYEYLSGTKDEIEKFSNFIFDYAEKDNPMELLIVIGNGEKNFPNIMLNTSKKYMIIKFIENSSYLGEPLFLQNY
jgi:hypothetical protein